jgi:rhamnosyltransferase
MPPVTPHDIAAVVVLYRPDPGVLDNIAAVAGQVARVFAVDNTEDPDPSFLERLRGFANLEYASMGGNEGIAAALNTGIERAEADGFRWVVTLDQDSRPAPDMVALLAGCASGLPASPTIGLVSPFHVMFKREMPQPDAEPMPLLTAMMSGDLLSVDSWEAAGRFDEALFIDQVDHDLCLRMARLGMLVIECRQAHIEHALGRVTLHRWPVRARVSNHSPLRRYYITRNRLIVGARFRSDYPGFDHEQTNATFRELAKIVVYESDKWAKLAMAWRGYRDYRRGVTGRYPGR